ncbi:MAG: DUF3438 family protein [Amphritea sp.]|nr:DUF3438 family protein [Amphritea sp.]
MGRNNFLRVFIMVALLLSSAVQAAEKLDQVEFKDASVSDAARILASLSGSNIAVTKEAGDERVTLLLQQTTLKHAVDMVARVTGLWYRYNRENDSYIIMTERQYQDDIVVHREDQIRTFTLRHQNVSATAVTIQSLFGDRVKLSLQKNNDDFQGLEYDSADEVTTVEVESSEDDEVVELQDLDRGDDLDEGQADSGIDQQGLKAGELRQLGERQVVDESRVGSILGAKTPIFIATNRIHNLLFVRTSDENAMAEIAALIRESDKPTPQVLLEMKIVEVNTGDGFTQDFDLSFSDEGLNQTITGNSLGFDSATGGYYSFLSRYINARISLLLEENQADIVAKPVIIASNNRPARLFIGGEQVIATGLTTSTTFSQANNNGDRTSETTQTLQTERRNVGNTLVMLPSVNADRTVTIDIIQDSSVIKRGGLNFPFFNNTTNAIETVALDSVDETNVKTIVVAKDGLTVALGGMVREEDSVEESVVPLLGDIPGIGELFRYRKSTYAKSQYVMLITPHVLVAPEESAEKSRLIAELGYDQNQESHDLDAGSKRSAEYSDRDFVELIRLAAGSGESLPPGVVEEPVPIAPLSFLFRDDDLSVWPLAGWQKNGLYVTSLKMRNQGDSVKPIDLSTLSGGWLAAAVNHEQLSRFGSAGDSGKLYLLSDRPFDQVLSEYNRRSR